MSSNPGWQETTPEASVLPAEPHESGENPSWSGWDVLYIVMVMLGSLVICLLAITSIARRVLFPHFPFMEVMGFPLVALSAQMAAYLVTLAFMFVTATQHSSAGFRAAVRWNWPRSWTTYVLAGIAFCIVLQLLARFLPMPRRIPMDTFFKTPLRAWVLSILGMSLVPLMEELFFRGFLYPVLARRLGLVIAVVATAVAFTSIHVPQLADPKLPFSSSWGAVLIIFIIGLALTLIRAIKKSVAAGVLVHMAYNGFTSLLAAIVSGGFRHLDRITQ